tara:strand:- start:3910 stop:5727 length:1818 start_codon:yes stop_codon:yes gene_type:complete
MAKKTTSHQISKQLASIKYTSRDYTSIKNDLVEYAKRYYPDNFKDFNDASFGALMLDSVAYVGDILSFYLDYQANESFLDTALEYSNVLKHGKALGYKLQRGYSANGLVSLYIMVPADSFGTTPDLNYMPVLKRGTQFSSTEGTIFTLTENIDFSDPTNEIVVARVNSTTGVPTYYAVKAMGQVISGILEQERVTIGEFEKFLRVRLGNTNITEIISIFDSEGHRYVEVSYLSQNIVYSAVSDRGSNKQATSILKAIPVARRYVVEHEQNGTYLQFGYGTDSEIFNDSIADPSELVLKVHGKRFITDTSLDPTNLLATDKFGIAPSNTILTVTYRTNTSDTVNASVGSVNMVILPNFSFKDRTSLDSSKIQSVIDSLESSNEERIIGSVTIPDIDELRHRIKNGFAAQNRAVTKQDYIMASYSMPPQFGAVKRCTIVKDHDSFKRNLNFYVISENKSQKLVTTNNTVKENLKTWLNGYKMINDTIDILDAKIVNIGIDFRVLGQSETNKYDILSLATSELQKAFDMDFDIGESISVTRIFKILNFIPGVVDTLDVKFTNKSSGLYSGYGLNIDKNTSADGRTLIAPEDVIFEIKYPTKDIRGTIV